MSVVVVGVAGVLVVVVTLLLVFRCVVMETCSTVVDDGVSLFMSVVSVSDSEVVIKSGVPVCCCVVVIVVVEGGGVVVAGGFKGRSQVSTHSSLISK